MKFTKNRIFLTFSISIFILFFIFLFRGTFYFIDDSIKSFIIKTKSNISLSENFRNTINNDLVFVKIDEKTIEKLGFPMSRKEYVPLIENLNKAGAEIIAFDIIFANDNKYDSIGDDAFAEAIKKAGNIVLGGDIIAKEENGKSKIIIEKPLEKFYTGALAFGYYRPNIDLITNRVTGFYPYYNFEDKSGEKNTYNHFSISILKAYYSKIYKKDFYNKILTDSEGFYLKPGYKIPFSQKGKKDILINFIPKPPLSEKKASFFPSYSFLDIYNGKIKPNIFKGKIVLVGATSNGIKDIFTTSNGIEYGIYVLGNIVNTILTKSYLVNFPEYLEWFLIFLLLILSVYFNLSRSGYVLILSNLAISIIFLLIFPIFISFWTSYLLGHIFELFLSLIFSLTIGNITKYLFENKNKIKLNKALSEYVSKAIAKEILTNSGDINLDGEKKEISIFFSDIEGFTTISENFEAEELVGFLREYLGNMSEIILENNGFIDKYEGDAIMALWGVFHKFDNSTELACKTAIKQQKLLKELNKNWKEKGFNQLKIRIGLHFGEAIVGNIGAKGKKLEYTALGDNVNLASRLEGVNKFYGTYTCASEEIYKRNKEKFAFRYLDEIRVKGKEKSVKIYELLDYKENITKENNKKITAFEKGVNFYKNKNFNDAKKIFLKLIELGDKPSITYADRCDYYIKFPPKENWDGVWTYTSKG